MINVVVSNEIERETRDPERREPRVSRESASHFNFNVISIVWELDIREICEFIFVYTWVATDIGSSFAICEVIRLSPPHVTESNEVVFLIEN